MSRELPTSDFGASCAFDVGSVASKLRESGAASDIHTSSEVDLGLVWRELVQGRQTVLDTFFTQTRCGIILAESAEKQRGLIGRRLSIIDAVLRGCAQGNIAIDMGLSPSTIAIEMRAALQAIGVRERPSRVHPLLMLAATAAALQDSVILASVTHLGEWDDRVRVIAVPRPERRLTGILSAAECAVVAGLVEGEPYVEIARRRATSVRTVANQAAAAFRRLRVSGRSELIHCLFSLEPKPPGWSLPISGLAPEPSPQLAVLQLNGSEPSPLRFEPRGPISELCGSSRRRPFPAHADRLHGFLSLRHG
jgi:DNA-binding NarL/FixJ family response regulator